MNHCCLCFSLAMLRLTGYRLAGWRCHCHKQAGQVEPLGPLRPWQRVVELAVPFILSMVVRLAG